MSYTKQTWVDLPSTTTPIDADALGHMEDGIEAAHDIVDAHVADTTSVHGITNTATLVTDVNAATAATADLAVFRENSIAVKVWDSGTSAYVPLSGVAPSGTVGLLVFIGPNDPASATGGSADAYTWWLDTT